MISKIIAEEKIVKAKSLIYEANKIAVVAHAAPDGDAMGSSLALYHFLYSIDKEATVIYPDAFPSFLSWMHGAEKALIFDKQKEEVAAVLNSVDLIICVDFNQIKRVGALAGVLEQAKANKILIDHHPEPDLAPWKVAISYPQIASTSELVFRLICRSGHASEINKYCAEAIYTGMMTDTGGFTFNSNNTEVYYIIAELIRKGINKDEIYRNVFNTYTADRMRLMGYLLSNKMKVYPEYKTALISLTADEQKQFNFRKGDSEGFVNMPLAIEGIVFSVFLKEDSDKIKVSLRSQGTFPVNEFSAKYFNGGGHLNASGGESYTSMEEAIAIFETALPTYKDTLNQ